MASIFTKIVKGEIPSYKIAENENFFAFLDIFPLRQGHVLVVPKTEVDKFFDLPEVYLSEMLLFAKPIAQAIEKAFDWIWKGWSLDLANKDRAKRHFLAKFSVLRKEKE